MIDTAPGKDWDANTIVAHLETLSSETNRAGMARFGIVTDRAFGVSNAVLRPLAKSLGKDQQRARALWETGIREARLLAVFTADPKALTLAEARRMAEDFNSWEIVDHAADLFVAAGFIDDLVPELAADDREFVRRTAFAMIAWGAVHLKNRPDAELLAFLPLIEAHAGDGRNFVKKAVNWALRQIGKRSPACHGPALALAHKLSESGNKAARWTGRSAVRELDSTATRARVAKKKNR